MNRDHAKRGRVLRESVGLLNAFGIIVAAALVLCPTAGLAAFTKDTVSGLVFWVDASDVDGDGVEEGESESGLTGTRVDTWDDKSNSGNNAVRQSGSSAGYPQIVTNQLNGKAVLRFNSGTANTGDYFQFTRITTIRTVFWVLKENSGLSDNHFLLGDSISHHFHRGTANGPFWDGTYAAAGVLGGTTKTNGVSVNGTTTSLPANQNLLITLLTSASVEANQITQDRTFHGSWQGDIAEILIFDTALSSSDELIVGSYLTRKYGLTTAYLGSVAVTNPVSGDERVYGNDVVIAASTSGGPHTNVFFYADGTNLGFDTSSPFSYTWTSAGVGSHSLTAVAWVDDANSVTSAPVAISVLEPLAMGTWGRKLKVTFSGYDRTETLTNFPAMVVFSTNITNFSYADFLSGTNSDLCFVNSNETRYLNYEVEQWNTNGTSTVWVSVQRLPSSNEYIYAYWGKSGVDAPACRTNGSVWTNYDAVWHLSDTNETGVYMESTVNTNHGTVSGAGNDPIAATGVAGGGKAFDTGDAMVSVRNTGITGNIPRTVSLWVKRTSTDQAGHYYLLGQNDANRGVYSLFHNNTTAAGFWAHYYEFNSSQVITQDVWYHTALRYSPSDSDYLRIIVNGTQAAADNDYAMATLARAAVLGYASWSWQGGLDFAADEFRISTVARSTNWLWAEYMNMATNGVFAGSFNSYGAVTSQNEDWPQVSMPETATNVQTTSAVLNGYLFSTGETDTAVYVFWGETDGGTNWANWSYTNSWAAPRDTGTYSHVASVSANKTYYYRYAASNAAAKVWATSTKSFITAPISIVKSSDASESGLTAGVFTVSRAGTATAIPVNVTYVVTGGSATSGSDYSALSGTVTIPGGSASATITVTPIYDRLIAEGTETLTVALLESTYYPIGAPTNESMNITDNATPAGGLDLIWDNNTANGTWDTTSFNWHLEGGANGSMFYVEGDRVLFSSVGGTVTLSAERSPLKVSFGSLSVSNVPACTLAGSTLVVGAEGVHQYNRGNSTTINCPMRLSTNATLAEYSYWPGNKNFNLNGWVSNAGHRLTIFSGGYYTYVNRPITGSGDVFLTSDSDDTVYLRTTNTFTGKLRVTGSQVYLDGAVGMVTNASRLEFFANAQVNIGETGANIGDDDATTFGRLPNSCPVVVDGAQYVRLVGRNSVATVERLGSMVVQNRRGKILVNNGTSSTATLYAETFGRDTNSYPVTVIGSGNYNLSGSSKFLLDDSGATLAHIGGSNSRTTDKAILPGVLSETYGLYGGNFGNTFALYDAANGFTPLDPTNDFVNSADTNFPAVNADGNDNVRLPWSTVRPVNANGTDATNYMHSSATINSLAFINDAGHSTDRGILLNAAPGMVLTLKSGMILAASLSNPSNPRFYITVNVSTIVLDNVRGYFCAAGTGYGHLTINSALVGNHGLTVTTREAGNSEGRVELGGDNRGLTGRITVAGGSGNTGNLRIQHQYGLGHISNEVFLAGGMLSSYSVNANMTMGSLRGVGNIFRDWNSGNSRFTVGGDGSVGASDRFTLTSGGVIAPGYTNMGGTITIGNYYSAILMNGGTLAVDLFASDDYDSLAAYHASSSPAVTLSGVSLDVDLHYLPQAGDTFLIMNVNGSTAVAGKFVEQDEIIMEYEGYWVIFDVLYNSSLGGGDGNDVVLRVASVEPMSGSVILFAQR